MGLISRVSSRTYRKKIMDDLFEEDHLYSSSIYDPHFKTAYNNAFKAGVKQGQTLGTEKGTEIGQLFGKIEGLTLLLLEELQSEDSSGKTSRTIRHCEKILKTIETFPYEEP